MNAPPQTISELCVKLSKDRLLVQGAGGNASWKDDGIIWVKGSGKWLANAFQENIFVPVDLNHLQNALSQKNYGIEPNVLATQAQKKISPSIETLLHALMPQKIVVHLHAIEVLSYLVVKDCLRSLQEIFSLAKNNHQVNGIFVGYHKPGPELAQVIHRELEANPTANVVFLKNHGIVVGAESIEAVFGLIKSITLNCPPKRKILNANNMIPSQSSAPAGYIAFQDSQVQELATNPELYKRLQFDWVLYPDHAVFLGPKAFTYGSWAAFEGEEKNNIDKPDLVFIQNSGVFVNPSFNLSKTAQLLCYYDVISRILPEASLDPLDADSINSLINWDAELLRRRLSK